MRLGGGGGGGGGGGRTICVRAYARGSGGMLQIRCSEIASEATFGPKLQYSSHCYLYIFTCMTLIRIDVHMPCSGRCLRVQTSEFPVLSTI